jgi:hypothetical protein
MNKKVIISIIKTILKKENKPQGFGLVVLQSKEDVKEFMHLLLELHPEFKLKLNQRESCIRLTENSGIVIIHEGLVENHVYGQYSLVCYSMDLNTRTKARLMSRLRLGGMILLEYGQQYTKKINNKMKYVYKIHCDLNKEN